VTAFALSFLGLIAVQGYRGSALAGAASNGTNVVHVAPPTGKDADRASILAAFAQARPGDTIQFGRGMYLVGKLISDSTPRLTLLGHPEGTTLRASAAAGRRPSASPAHRDGSGRGLPAERLGVRRRKGVSDPAP
jgi:hypothetical protein